jgi:porphobilinogen deaminase
LRSIEHQPSRIEADAERELIRAVEEHLKIPVGGLAAVRRDQIQIEASILTLRGEERLVASRSGLATEGEKLAREISEEFLARGAGKVAESWRTSRR